MRLMLAAVVVELDPIGGKGSEFGYGLIAPQSKLFIFQTPPKPLDEDVVHPTASPIHADLDTLLLKLGDPLFSGELAALIRVEDLWFATRAAQRLFQSPHAKGAVHGVADFPSENGPAVPIHDCHHVGVTFRHRNVGNVSAPDFVDGVDFAFSQQIGKNLMTLGRNARRGLRHQGFDPHDAHQPPDPFAPDVVAVIPEIFAEIPLSVERTLYVKPIHDLHDFTVFLGGFGLAGGEPVSVDS